MKGILIKWIWVFGLAAGFSLIGGPCEAGLISTDPIAVFNDFTSTGDVSPSSFQPYHCNYSASNGTLNITFAPRVQGSAGLLVLNDIHDVDVSQGGGMGVNLMNPNSVDLNLYIMIFDDSGHEFGASVLLPAGEDQEIACVIHPPRGADVGMMGIPAPYANASNIFIHGSSDMDWAHIANFQIYCFGPFSSPVSLKVSKLGVLKPYTDVDLLTGDCDQYGQSTVAPVVNQVTTDQQLVDRLNSEMSTLNAQGPLLKSVDAYNGSLTLPKQTPTGRFYLKQVNGKWWLVDPLGNLFWLSGVDTVDPDAAETPLNPIPAPTGQDRTPFFQWLPTAADPLSQYYEALLMGGITFQTYNFYDANLHRKFQTDQWLAPWQNMAVQRLQNWGFTGFGSYSDPIAYSNHTLPYVTGLSLTGTYDTINTGNTLFAELPDPYDPDFGAAVQYNMTNLENMIHYDSKCIGVYTGIEMSWTGPDGPMNAYGIAAGCLSAPYSQPAHQAMLNFLMRKYRKNIRILNKMWGTSFTSFSAITLDPNGPGPSSYGMAQDMLAWEKAYCHQFFSVCRNIIKAADPNMLYLGTEISHYCSPVMQGAAGVVDAMCDNRYAPAIDPTILADAQAANIPLLITEFCVSTPAVGMFPPAGIYSTPTIEARNAAAQAFYDSVITNPQVIGVDWFKYVDFALYGDSQFAPLGNNYNAGLVSITDTPYSGLIQMFQNFHSTMYETRY